MWFNINIQTLVVNILPTFLRGSVMVSWLHAILSPLQKIQDDFLRLRTRTQYHLAHNSQVCRMRALLNDYFDPTLRRIKILDGDVYDDVYIYTKGENQPKFLPTYIRTQEEMAGGVNFKVIIPTDVVFNMDDLRAKINEFKLVSRKYIIEIKDI